MENVEWVSFYVTGIKDLPCSLCNLSRLKGLSIGGDEMCKIPSVIAMMPQLSMCNIWLGGNKRRVSEKQEDGLHGILTPSLPSSKVKSLKLAGCNLSDEFFPLALAWFPNVEILELWDNNFTFLPECIKEFRFLWWLNVDNCQHLQEIRGVPPNLEYFSAVACKLLNPMGTSVLVKQKVHEDRWTRFVMPGRRIPRWFEQRRSGSSISFWFRGTIFPYDALSFAVLILDDIFPCRIEVTPVVTINGNRVCPGLKKTAVDQLFIFSIRTRYHYSSLHFEKGWNHVEVSCEAKIASLAKEIGMHGLKPKDTSIIQDIRFTDPYNMTEIVIMMMMLSIVFPNHKKQPLPPETCIGLWTLLFLTI
ncbi:hypothetical protein PIB30_004285 [Stylosanthes scabra]|uniref:Disease resistance protein RPS4B/Roq1-like leucine-rich repeats domain-containing protein n=1 Tax=Stylosanthes scabra TaxID=79078 RepID=A0ABU6T495_9FABA|nr:hypothetical protein [Stylosanthes scabra]